MVNFYGGQPGKDFRIAHVFKNKKEALADLNQGIVSPIGVGEYIVISYGDVDSNDYLNNLNEDGNEKSYNGCFYKKDYETNEAKTGLNDIVVSDELGWVYRFISRMTGPIPRFNNVVKTNIVEGLQDLTISINSENPDKPEMIMDVPKPSIGISILPSTQDPTVAVDKSLHFSFELPKGVEMHQVTNLEEEKENAIDGDLYFVPSNGHMYQYDSEQGEFVFLWDFTPTVETQLIAFNEESSVQATLDNNNGYTLTFKMPQQPNITTKATLLQPGSTPKVEKKITDTGYEFDFQIPKGDQGEKGNKGDKGDAMIIWSAQEPLEFIGPLLELAAVKSKILEYLTEKFSDNYPKTAGELLPITYIYNVDSGLDMISLTVDDNTLPEGIEEYSNGNEDQPTGDISLVDATLKETLVFTDKTILGFFAYYTDKWNIFLAPNGSGAGSLKWEGEEF